MTKLMNRFVQDESGATAIEYALMAGLIGVMLIAALQAFQGQLSAAFGTIGGKLSAIK